MSKPSRFNPDTTELELIESISVADLVESWRRDFGLHIGHLFEGVEELCLVKEQGTGLSRFDPPISGDPAFYQGLRQFRWYHPKSKTEHRIAARWFKVNCSANGAVLDVGAGDGRFADVLSGADYAGLETDAEAVAAGVKAGRKLLAEDLETYLQRDNARAEMVTAFQLLEHVANPDALLSAMTAATAPGGFVVVGVPNFDSYIADLPDFMLNAPPHHVSWWTASALEKLFVRHGLTPCHKVECSLEAWERQLWWMAAISKRLRRRSDLKYFGQGLRTNKIASFLLSSFAQWIPLWRKPKGSTLVMIAQKS